jgi:hypothetical protein
MVFSLWIILQVSAVDDLIDAMSLEAEEEGGGTAWLLNPEEQCQDFCIPFLHSTVCELVNE